MCILKLGDYGIMYRLKLISVRKTASTWGNNHVGSILGGMKRLCIIGWKIVSIVADHKLYHRSMGESYTLLIFVSESQSQNLFILWSLFLTIFSEKLPCSK